MVIVHCKWSMVNKTMLTIRQLYPILRNHQKLSERRSPMFNQGKVAKFMAYLMVAMLVMYLIGFSISLALMATDVRSMTAYEFMYAFLPFVMTLDFFARFLLQQTPSQQVKPYVLLPIPRYTCIDFFIIRSLLSYGNLVLMFLYVPFALMAVVFAEGIWLTILFLFGFYVIELIVSQVYSIFRTLVSHNMLYWFLIIPLLALVASPLFFNADWSLTVSFDRLMRGYAHLGGWICKGNAIAWASLFAVLCVVAAINRRLQHKFVYAELSREEKAMKVSTKQSFKFLNEWGVIGEFLRLELFSIRRNKNVRKTFISSNVIVLVLSLLCSFSSVYDDLGMVRFWLIYNFSIYGAMMLLRIMTFEGNYIERLMMGHHTIEKLLVAKFYFYSAILLFPFILMIPMVITGKASLLMLFSYMAFTAGVGNFLFMQLAVYNKQTAPLNQKFTGRTMIENSWIMIFIEILAFTMPILLIKLFMVFASENTAYIILLVIGLIFIGTHRLWLGNIYKRLNKRKYENIEAMMATR